MDSQNPTGFGRIIRNENGEAVGIIEEKNATDQEKMIQEINLGCYIIDKKYLEENIKDIKRNPVTGEYYITDIIDIISHHQGKIAAYKLADKKWQGVNTREDLIEAERILSNE
jgi:bifunctional UDP-N-acetylglucosamine pyrophosphorylase/glucosamine-1-phosphate N-acetyltransferase